MYLDLFVLQLHLNSEVDYLMVINDRLVPVEVKSGKTGFWLRKQSQLYPSVGIQLTWVKRLLT